MKNFITTVWQSVYAPDFYRGLRDKPLSFSFKYFYLLITILAVVFTVITSMEFVPVAVSLFRSVGPAIIERFPDELVVTIKDGTASTNVSEPYIIPISQDIEQNAVNPQKNFLVIDTQNEVTLDRIREYDASLFLTRDAFIMQGSNNQLRIQDLRSFPDMTIDKARVAAFVGKMAPLAKFVGPLVVLVTFAGIFIVHNFKLVYFLIAALLVWAIVSIKKLDLGYKKSYQIAMHAATLPLLLSIFTGLGVLPSVRFIPTILLLVVVWINLKFVETVPVAPKPAA